MRIGFFDSGIGGLSVLRHALQHIPGAEFVYVADSAFAPYGDRPAEWVRQRSLYIARFLQQQGLDALVIACNTATALAAELIREELTLPVIAMEPAIKPAAGLTRSGRVGVLATATTLASTRYKDLCRRYASGVELFEYAPHHWVEQIEQGGHLQPKFTESLAKELSDMLQQGVDTWVLACTHFPFIAQQLQQILGPDAQIIDPAPAVIAQMKRCLPALATNSQNISSVQLLTSGDLARVSQQAGRFLGQKLMAKSLPCAHG